MPFGKHKGRTFKEIAVEEPEYLEWMLGEGAGSLTERECAQMALGELKGGYSLPAAKRRATRKQISGRRLQSYDAAPPPTPTYQSLPDPARPGGIWDRLKGLLRGGR
jgi:hypothetical protein